MAISPPTRHQMENNCCGTCKQKWRDCKCKPDLRTESVESLLSNDDLFQDPVRRHTCVFLYHTYQRWSPALGQGSDEFDLSLLPVWEGWYAAWLKPEIDHPEQVPWSENPVLNCSVRYFDGTCLDGHIDTDGKLLLNVPGVRTPYGKDFDEDRKMVRMAVSVSQTLTIEEIRTQSRGMVYGGRSPPNSWRSVSHVVREKDGTCVVRVLAEKDGVPGKDVKIEAEKMNQFVPHMLDEVRWRRRRRFGRSLAKEVQRYLHALIERSRLNDEAVRFALKRGWLDSVPSPGTLIRDIGKEMASLSDIANGVGPSDTREPVSENTGMGEV